MGRKLFEQPDAGSITMTDRNRHFAFGAVDTIVKNITIWNFFLWVKDRLSGDPDDHFIRADNTISTDTQSSTTLAASLGLYSSAQVDGLLADKAAVSSVNNRLLNANNLSDVADTGAACSNITGRTQADLAKVLLTDDNLSSVVDKNTACVNITGKSPSEIAAMGSGYRIIKAGSYYIGDIGGAQSYTVSLGTVLSSSNYIVMLTARSHEHGNEWANDIVWVGYKNRTTISFDIYVFPTSGGKTESLAIDWIIIALV